MKSDDIRGTVHSQNRERLQAVKGDDGRGSVHSLNGKRLQAAKSDDGRGDVHSHFQIGAGLYVVGRPVQKRNEEDGQIGTNHPCPSREGPYSTVFSVSRPMDPLMWLAGLLAL